ncbi:DUF222 domain-containing protein [Arthrobacter sp. NPDC056493]|uniref:HNH endonuclease signature motif containing protein n=1 Tax=Arthrobacter sp. NPDC056493 TaxID=3345839 RepID=UPI00367130F6
MDNGTAAAEVLEAIGASALALAAELRRAAGAAVLDPAPAGADPLPHHVDPLGEQAAAFLGGLTGVAGMEARLAAVKVQFAAGYAAADAAMAGPGESPQDVAVRQMSVTAEVAGALTISEGAAARLLVESSMLSTDLPVTLGALRAGSISWQHGRVMCDETDGLSAEAAAALEAHFLDPDASNRARGCPAGELTPARFRAKARYWRERHHQDSIETRHRNSVKDRRLEYVPARDGMAWLSAFLPADQAAGIWNRSTAAARAAQGPTETRTLSQLRADVFSTGMLGPVSGIDGTGAAFFAGPVPAGAGPAGVGAPSLGAAGDGPAADGTARGVPVGDVPSPRAQVLVTVPVFSLLGLTEEPATLDGYGPIPASMARRLVADGARSFLRVLTDPRDGAPLEIGRTSYRLTKPMRQWLRLRDARCTFPGCNNHSLDNDADHILAWADGGTTGVANLGQPCPKHHRLKHASAWTPVGATRESPPGWISPAGRSYPTEYQDWEPPHWPDSLEPDSLDPDSLERGNFDLDRPENLGPPLPLDPLHDWSPPSAA